MHPTCHIHTVPTQALALRLCQHSAQGSREPSIAQNPALLGESKCRATFTLGATSLAKAFPRNGRDSPSPADTEAPC